MPKNPVETGSGEGELGYNKNTAIDALTTRINEAEVGALSLNQELATHIYIVLNQHRALLANIQGMTDEEFAQGNMSTIVQNRLSRDY